MKHIICNFSYHNGSHRHFLQGHGSGYPKFGFFGLWNSTKHSDVERFGKLSSLSKITIQIDPNVPRFWFIDGETYPGNYFRNFGTEKAGINRKFVTKIDDFRYMEHSIYY